MNCCSLSGPDPNQAFVISNGPTIDLSYSFTAHGSQQISADVVIGNDDVALEDTETYNIAFSSPSNSDMILGSDAIINIADDDGKHCIEANCSNFLIILVASISFDEKQYSFLEPTVSNSDVMATISTSACSKRIHCCG